MYFVWLLPFSIFILRLSVLKHISIVCSLLLLSRINDVTVRLSVHLGMDIWDVSRLLLFGITASRGCFVFICLSFLAYRNALSVLLSFFLDSVSSCWGHGHLVWCMTVSLLVIWVLVWDRIGLSGEEGKVRGKLRHQGVSNYLWQGWKF